jgi:hypothetical protein
MLLLNLLELALLITILVFVIMIFVRQKNQAKEGFDNCFGAQYYGEPFYNNYKNKICARGTTQPLYPEGGCAVYDPEKISAEYAQGKFTPAV